MKSIKRFSILAALFTVALLSSCKKDKANTTITPTSFTFNGVKYNTARVYVKLDAATFGSDHYSALVDSAVSEDKTKVILFEMVFNKVGRPSSGSDYYVYVPSGLPASTPDLITTLITSVDLSNGHYTVYEATNSGTDQTATVTNDGKLVVDFPETSFDGTVYDSTGTMTDAIASFLFSRTTFKEQ
ncbi:MAG: hypothetical protein U0U67_16745 [Chitinophagales bacterium]